MEAEGDLALRPLILDGIGRTLSPALSDPKLCTYQSHHSPEHKENTVIVKNIIKQAHDEQRRNTGHTAKHRQSRPAPLTKAVVFLSAILASAKYIDDMDIMLLAVMVITTIGILCSDIDL
jgi:hypothetical protein